MPSLMPDLDKLLFDWINTGWGNPLFDFLMPAVTRLADGRFTWIWVILIGLIGFWRLSPRRRGEAGSGLYLKRLQTGLQCLLYAALVYGVTAGINGGLKDLFDRPRPFLQQGVHERIPHRMQARLAQSGSFPSGHACNAFWVATLLVAQFRRPRCLFYTLAALIALSRVYLGVHYPTDVLAGGLLGGGIPRLLLKIPAIDRHLTGASPPATTG